MKLIKVYNTKKHGKLRALIEIDGKKYMVQADKQIELNKGE